MERDIIENLQRFMDQLEFGEPLVGTRVSRVETPDGPMHLHNKVIFMTKKQIHDRIKKGEQFFGFYETGELFINTKDGDSVYNKYMEWEVAEEICDELGISLEEV